jgi:hypothetical protein
VQKQEQRNGYRGKASGPDRALREASIGSPGLGPRDRRRRGHLAPLPLRLLRDSRRSLRPPGSALALFGFRES